MAPSTTRTAPRRRSERQLTPSTTPPPKKTPRRSSKTDPNVKPLLFWSADEVANLVQAWRDTIANPPARARATAGGFNERMYKRFVALSGGSTIRALQSMVSKKQLLNNSFQFIAAYNARRSSEVAAKADGSSSSSASTASSKTTRRSATSKKTAASTSSAVVADPAATEAVNHWFELSKPQRKTVAIQARMTEQRQFALLNMNRTTYDRMRDVARLERNMSVRQSWTDADLDLLFRAWREALTTRPAGTRNPLLQLNMRTFEFMRALSNGTCTRTKQSVVLKKDALRVSHEFITAFDEAQRDAHAATSDDGTTTPVKRWFDLTLREQERIVARNVAKSGFVYFTPAQFACMAALVADTARLGIEHGVRQGAGWTHDETTMLLRAWRDVVDTPLDELQAHATIGVCVYHRFVHLSNGATIRSARSTVLKLEALAHMFAFIVAYDRAAAREARAAWLELPRVARRRVHNDAMRARGSADDRRHTFTDLDAAMVDAMTVIVARNRPLDARTDGRAVSRDSGSDDDNDDGDDDARGSGIDESRINRDNDASSEADDDESDYAPTTRRGRAAKTQRTRRRQSTTTAKLRRTAAARTVLATAAHAGDEDDRLTESASEQNDRVNDDDDDDSADAAATEIGVTHSFLQVRSTAQPQLRAQQMAAADGHCESDGGDVDSSDSRTESTMTTTKRLSKRELAAASHVPAPFRLHELADLAMRVNAAASDSDASTDSRVCDTGATAASVTTATASGTAAHLHASSSSSSSSSLKKRRVRADVAAMVEIFHVHSMQIVRAVETIRDEIRVDRERFMDEMRSLRHDRRRQRSDDDDDSNDDRRFNAATRMCRQSSSRTTTTTSTTSSDSDGERATKSQTKKQKTDNERLSVQRDGFVVRL